MDGLIWLYFSSSVSATILNGELVYQDGTFIENVSLGMQLEFNR